MNSLSQCLAQSRRAQEAGDVIDTVRLSLLLFTTSDNSDSAFMASPRKVNAATSL